MASEYLLKKYKDVKPDEPRELTKKEKRANWWHYHRLMLLVIALAAVFVVSFVWEIVSKTEPDFQLAYVGEYSLDEETVELLEQTLTALATDRNGDGEVVVQVTSFINNEEDPMAYVTQMSLVADMSVGQSDFYLLADPVVFQDSYGMLTMTDGSEFDDGMDPEGTERVAFADCAGLGEIDLGQELYLCRRIPVSDDKESDRDALEEMWNAMVTGGAQ